MQENINGVIYRRIFLVSLKKIFGTDFSLILVILRLGFFPLVFQTFRFKTKVGNYVTV